MSTFSPFSKMSVQNFNYSITVDVPIKSLFRLLENNAIVDACDSLIPYSRLQHGTNYTRDDHCQ